MSGHTTKRSVATITLAAALLGATACGRDATNQTAAEPATPTSPADETPETAPDPSTATTVLRPTATVDELVGVDGGRLHVRCVGAGDTTVVLIAGFNDGGDNWGRIVPALSRRAASVLLRPLRHRHQRSADGTADLRHLGQGSPRPPERDRRDPGRTWSSATPMAAPRP